ncbi:MCE family protein [Nocardioides sp. R-C-SC26]|uniref:MCE family protein n=1 Tax=Nocardioides sp. R-C-SC26 TaxID=2870414 RepID=UPI001E4B6150|nr:MCE family protein [Nocardioides sp. R-C-SC26]
MARKPLSARDPFKVGLVALGIVFLLGVAVVLVSVASFGAKSYTAELEHTAGLRVGEDVQVHGVSKGKVTGIELSGRSVVVTFDLDSDIDLGSESSAEVKVATLLGTHYLQVEPEGSGELADSRIPVERTSVPYNLQDALEAGTGALTDLDAETLAEALAEVADTLDAAGDEVGPALEGVASLSQLVSARSEQTAKLLQAARDVADQLSSSSDDIVGLMRSTNLVVAEITARRQAINLLLTETRRLTANVDGLIGDADRAMGPALRDIDRALTALRNQDRTLRYALDTIAPAVRYVANATGSGPWVDLYAKGPVIPTDDMLCRLGNCP